MDIPVIDLSTPETLERDFYAWLNGNPLNVCNKFESFSVKSEEPLSDYQRSSLPSLETISCPTVPYVTDYSDVYQQQYCTYIESSESGSPSSLSCSSMEYDVPPPPQHERDVARSSGGSGRNQLGRTYSPGLPLSMFEREEIVKLFQAGWKICDISKRLCVTHSCVSKILNRFRQTGSVKPKDAKEGRMESPLVLAVRDYRSRLGMCRQSEIREQLIRDGVCTRENAPSRSSINHILRTKLDIKRRRKAN
ncbi:unnamed protein product [Caenorhabditis auriculariae]|uniref:Paired domain-containing protein n=1 Tax=Caenorhabditis auriculariae TaxID=2777116 RepID=A0A8S1GVZ9_9PELO|nr:unnamed protein product [Caenorhabditis auriculariae]